MFRVDVEAEEKKKDKTNKQTNQPGDGAYVRHQNVELLR